MRSRTAPDFVNRCRRCYLHHAHCLCAEVPRLANRTRIVLVRHVLEALKTTNTGRIALLALPNSLLLDYGGPQPLDYAPLREPGSWLLYPGGTPTDIRGLTAPTQLVVLDGSWSQARRMMRHVPALRSMPRLVLPAPQRVLPKLRQPPFPGALSTLESVAEALAVLEGESMGGPLRVLHQRLVDGVLDTRGRSGAGTPREAWRAGPRTPEG